MSKGLTGVGDNLVKMALAQKEADIQMLLAAGCHLGTKNCNFQMERYVHKRRQDGVYVINLEKTWEKLHLAARMIVAIENPQDVVVLSARPYGQRAVFKFAQYLGCKSLAGRHTPGTFTNQIQKVGMQSCSTASVARHPTSQCSNTVSLKASAVVQCMCLLYVS